MGIKAIDVRKGSVVNFKDGLWTVISNEKVAKGNWRSYQVIKLKNVLTGQSIEDRFRTDEDFTPVFLDRKPMEYLYSTTDAHVLMDQQSYEQVEMPADLIGNDKVYLTPNLVIQVGFVEGKAVTVELPNTVELTVIDTPPQVRGATATNQLKDAECEGGAKIKVPPFVENGTVVKVDTRTGEYLGRA